MNKVGRRGLTSLSAYEVSLFLGQLVEAVAFVAPFKQRQASEARGWAHLQNDVYV